MSDLQTTTSTTDISASTPAPASSGPAAAPTPTIDRVARDAARAARPTEVTSFRHGSVIAEPDRTKEQVHVIRTDGTPRSFTDHQRAMLANLDKHGSFEAPPADPNAPNAPAVAAASPAPATAAPVVAAPVAAPAPAVTPPAPMSATTAPSADHARLLEHNRRLVAENEQLRASTAPSTSDERYKALDELERTATTEPLQAIRRLIALNAGIADPKDPAVDRLMAGIYSEWTGEELKLQMEPGKRAEIGTERNRLLIERDRRDRAAQEAARTAGEGQRRMLEEDAAVGRGLNAQFERTNHSSKYPLLMRNAQAIDHVSPGDLLWRTIRHGLKAGEFPADADDGTLIEHYSSKIETYYQGLRDQLAGAPPSTATPTQATVPSTDKQADANQAGVRTITNASASVAPASPPVATAAATPPAQSKPVKVREDERRRQLAAKHFPGD